MSEFEFDCLLDAVNDALDEQVWSEEEPFAIAPPAPANDNQLTWSLVPFPRGWHASC